MIRLGLDLHHFLLRYVRNQPLFFFLMPAEPAETAIDSEGKGRVPQPSRGTRAAQA